MHARVHGGVPPFAHGSSQNRGQGGAWSHPLLESSRASAGPEWFMGDHRQSKRPARPRAPASLEADGNHGTESRRSKASSISRAARASLIGRSSNAAASNSPII